MRMMREWRFLKMMKRAGRGHDPAGIAATKPGECAVLCPACPQPGINLPEDWKYAPLSKRYDFVPPTREGILTVCASGGCMLCSSGWMQIFD
jgi:hypothetical protein